MCMWRPLTGCHLRTCGCVAQSMLLTSVFGHPWQGRALFVYRSEARLCLWQLFELASPPSAGRGTTPCQINLWPTKPARQRSTCRLQCWPTGGQPALPASVAAKGVARRQLASLASCITRLALPCQSQIGSTAAIFVSCSLCCSLREDKVTIVALHPGWVDTDLGSSSGQLKPPLKVHTSVADQQRVIAGLKLEDSGRFVTFADGKDIPY